MLRFQTNNNLFCNRPLHNVSSFAYSIHNNFFSENLWNPYPLLPRRPGRLLSYDTMQCVKSVQIRSFFCSVFSCIWTEYGDLLRKSPYSVQVQENTEQKKLRIWTPSSHNTMVYHIPSFGVSEEGFNVFYCRNGCSRVALGSKHYQK